MEGLLAVFFLRAGSEIYQSDHALQMIPFVTLCAFTLIGIEGIASEIGE